MYSSEAVASNFQRLLGCGPFISGLGFANSMQVRMRLVYTKRHWLIESLTSQPFLEQFAWFIKKFKQFDQRNIAIHIASLPFVLSRNGPLVLRDLLSFHLYYRDSHQINLKIGLVLNVSTAWCVIQVTFMSQNCWNILLEATIFGSVFYVVQG